MSLIKHGGRLREQRDLAHALLTAIPGLSCVQAAGALYLFVRLDPNMYSFTSDEKFVLDLLEEQKVLVSHGTAFNWNQSDHFRFVILPTAEDIEEAINRIAAYLSTRRNIPRAASPLPHTQPAI